MSRSSRIALLCAVLVVVGAVVAMAAWRAGEQRARESQAMHAAWRATNQTSLLALSVVGRLSVDEQARFDKAANDPDRMRDVLAQIHEERLTEASKDLEDARARKVSLEGASGYKVFPDEPQPRDLVALANQDEWAATGAVTQYVEALERIRAWQPVRYPEFVQRGGKGGTQVAGTAPGPAPAAVQQKPDPRVPLNMPDGRPRPLPARSRIPAPVVRQPEAQETSARGLQGADGGVPDRARQQQDEAAIRETLQRWAGAMVMNDPQAETAAYAPHLNRYFLRTNVDRGFVEADKAAYLRRGNRTASFALRDVQIENETDNTADVRLVKDVTWDQSSSGATHKLIRSQLWLVRTGAGWRISGERDFR